MLSCRNASDRSTPAMRGGEVECRLDALRA
jgi:hypothetical protein